ncbi:MAG: Ig-like domain-containing protein [Candidatus Hydrogenedentales bacterium]|jgi:hypothetical protein
MDSGNITFGFQLGVAAVKLGTYGQAEGAAADLGRTMGGVELSFEKEVKEVETDQDAGPVAAKEVKRKGKLKFKMAESSLAGLCAALGLPASAVVGGRLSLGAPAQAYKTVYLNVDGPAGGARKYTLHKCMVTGASPTAFKRDEPSSIEVEAVVLFDTTQAAGEEYGWVDDASADTTAPTVALSTPADGGTVVKATLGTVAWQFTEAGQMDRSTLVYGKNVLILNITVPASASLVAGTLAYDNTTKVMTFTPSGVWVASDSLQAIVTTGVKDANGNALAATKVEQFSVTA